MRSSPGTLVLIAALVLAAASARSQEPPGPDPAERQYRTARRLGADGSPDAPAAFEKVVAMSPQGPYADDALVDLARLQGAPEWPEDLGALTAARAASARASLEKAVRDYPRGDRAPEAAYLLALLRLAPLPGRDAARGRQDLIALTGDAERTRWGIAARYALAVLDERAGARDRAASGFARIVVDRPDSDVAPRARAGFGRTLLGEERFGEAAGWFQDAIADGAPASVAAPAHRALALRELVRGRKPAERWTSITGRLAVTPTSKGAALVAAAADGRIVVFDRKNGLVQSFDAEGRGTTLGTAADVTALAIDPFGRTFAATKDQLLRWDASGHAGTASLGAFGSPASIAVDAEGAVWMADRKGERILRWAEGATAPVVIRESKGAGVSALVAYGGGVIAAEEKTGRLVAVTAGGGESTFGAATFRRPVAMAADVAGRVSVLDEKAGTVTRLAPGGEVRDTLGLETGGVSRPVGIAAGPDGTLYVLDGSTGAVAVAP